MKMILSTLALLCACSGQSEETKCIMDGSYDFGGIPSNGCEAIIQRLSVYGHEVSCNQDLNDFNVQNGLSTSGYSSCDPGDPVVQCTGFLSRSDGCTWELYTRRVVR